MPAPPALLRAVVMRADRSRAGRVVATAVASVVLSIALIIPLSNGIFALIGLLLLAGVHRTLFIKLTPSLPSAGAVSVLFYARTRWLMRAVGTIAFGFLAVYTSLGYQGLLLRACAASSCPAGASPFAAAFAALVGVAIGVDYALDGADEVLLPGGPSLWPLIAQAFFLRLRPTLPSAAARAARLSVQCAVALLLLAWVSPSLVLRAGTAALAAGGSCGACVASAHSASASAPVPGLAELCVLAVRAIGFRLCVAAVLAAVRIAYTSALDLRAATHEVGDDAAAASEAALAQALAKSATPLTQHLAYYDAATFAQHDPHRRRALLALERGSSWSKFLKLLLQPLEASAAALEAARKRRVAPPPPPKLPLVPRPLLVRLQRMHAALLEQCSAAAILGAAQPTIWAAEALSGLVAASAAEDSLGAVQHANSLALTLGALLRTLQALEAYMAGGSSLGGAFGAAGALGGGGSARARAPATRSQQSLALRVALGPPAQSRAAGFEQTAAALEGALSRAVYLLVHTFGRRVVLACELPSELRPRLEIFVSELY